MTAHINIGTNLGHREANLRIAARLLSEHVGPVTAISPFIESMPWGYDSPHAYLNCGVNVETELDAPSLVKKLRAIELMIDADGNHRTATGGYADRVIDLDLIALDSCVCALTEATVPHPRMHLREFVLRPMACVWPGWRHPLLNTTAAQLLGALHNNEKPSGVII